MLKAFWKGFINLIYPHNCLNCHTHLAGHPENQILCLSCFESLEANRPPFCLKCSRHLEYGSVKNLCPECLASRYDFDRAFAAFLYNATMQKLIHFFKYQNKTSLARILSRLILSFLKTHRISLSGYDCLIPMPLHPARLRERGYNQSELIADNLSRALDIPRLSGNLARRRHTRNQALLGKKDRWTNTQDAFTIINSKKFKGKRVLLFDDLLTTGATASEAARALKTAGAKRVDILTLAIAVLK